VATVGAVAVAAAAVVAAKVRVAVSAVAKAADRVAADRAEANAAAPAEPKQSTDQKNRKPPRHCVAVFVCAAVA
jgi:predicted short-subunit dehydrogenase-like oxidoreductase (DUF2520 family)